MDQLFAIDAQTQAQKLTHSDRHLLRQQKARPLLEQIKGAVEAARVQALPSSALAKGCNYTLTLWSRPTRFLDYPQLELSNNLAENAIRPVALGRRYEQFGIRQSSLSFERKNSRVYCAAIG